MLTLADSGDTADIVVLRAPREAGSLPIMRVVIGGVASRHALSVEKLDDLTLALETLLRDEPAEGLDLLLTVSVCDDMFKVTLGGLTSQALRLTLEGTNCADQGGERPLDVRWLMDSFVDEYRTVDGDTVGSFAVEMEKRIS